MASFIVNLNATDNVVLTRERIGLTTEALVIKVNKPSGEYEGVTFYGSADVLDKVEEALTPKSQILQALREGYNRGYEACAQGY